MPNVIQVDGRTLRALLEHKLITQKGTITRKGQRLLRAYVDLHKEATRDGARV